jgi:hypothetical protein
MSVPILRSLVASLMAVILPVSLLAADSSQAILHAKDGVLINGSEAHDSTAIVSGDLIETKTGAAADLTADGSTVVIQPESIVKFNGDSLTLEHGSVLVGTSKLLSVYIDCIRVVPVSSEWTEYDVSDLNGTVQVNARKLDVNIDFATSVRKPSPERTAAQSATVHEGEQATRSASEVCGVGRPAGATNSTNIKWIEIGGGAAGGVLVLCLLLCKGKQPPQTSPSQP